jgi:hypothetical protein
MSVMPAIDHEKQNAKLDEIIKLIEKDELKNK